MKSYWHSPNSVNIIVQIRIGEMQRAKYTSEFKEEAVLQVVDKGHSPLMWPSELAP